MLHLERLRLCDENSEEMFKKMWDPVLLLLQRISHTFVHSFIHVDSLIHRLKSIKFQLKSSMKFTESFDWSLLDLMKSMWNMNINFLFTFGWNYVNIIADWYGVVSLCSVPFSSIWLLCHEKDYFFCLHFLQWGPKIYIYWSLAPHFKVENLGTFVIKKYLRYIGCTSAECNITGPFTASFAPFLYFV